MSINKGGVIMDFIDQIKQFSKRVESIKDTIQTEEATKTSILMPFFQLMGFDVFNPNEFVPEFTADVGIKKGEKVDYAIVQDDVPVILIEAKSVNEHLHRHDSQLFRYFGTTTAKFAILTNGLIYKFFTDLDEPNKMDENPFMEINILDLKDTQISELKKFTKSSFNIEDVLNTASELKYTNEIKRKFNDELSNPTDDFVRYIINDIYNGMKTQNIIDKFRPIIKRSLNQYINETLNDKIKTALNPDIEEINETELNTEDTQQQESKIITTQEELEAYFLIKNLLRDTIPYEDIYMKDTANYMNILYKNNTRKWICRLILTDTQKKLIIPDENKKDIIFALTTLYDLEQYKEEFIEVLQRYM